MSQPTAGREVRHEAARRGLYRPQHERDACGVAMVATLTGRPSHTIVAQGLEALRNLEHRGATGAEVDTGDGAGLLMQIPDAFLRETGVLLPPPGAYAVGSLFLPPLPEQEVAARRMFERIATEESVNVLGWREVPVDPATIGPTARATMPAIRQVFCADPAGRAGLDLDRLLYPVRKRFEHEWARQSGVDTAYICSLSARTLIYKGMLTAPQLAAFYPDLRDSRLVSALVLVHSRFSTNTFPSWPLAHPYRLIAHNGEINTVAGNRNWMRARESTLASAAIPGDLQRLLPICTPGASDSASFDEVLELLHLGGRSLPHAMLMMIPEAWENNPDMDPARRAFYQFHASIMEPWDGPACVTFTDGTVIGAVLDRNGLRPGRFWVTDDGLVVLGSEAGVLDLPAERIVRKGRLQPGRMFLVDTAAGVILEDEQVKSQLAAAAPYGDWVTRSRITVESLPAREHVVHTRASVLRRQQTFGFTEEECRLILAPMARGGIEPIGSMGTDTPIAALSERPRLLFDYFSQLFAQVTNPPLDAIREEIVTSLVSTVGPEGNLLAASEQHAQQVVLPFPVIDNDALAALVHIDADGRYPHLRTARVRGRYDVAGGGAALRARLSQITAQIDEEIAAGCRFIVLSDRDSDASLAPIPSLLLTSAVHHHLVRRRTRTQVGLFVEAGDVREVHHIALLIGYGAAAVVPYLAMETVEDMARSGLLGDISPERAVRNLIKALGKGLLKVMSKMGVSTVASYRGAQIFEAIGLSEDLVAEYFTGTTTSLGGVDLDVIAEEVRRRHAVAYPPSGISPAHRSLAVGGEYQWRREGEPHLFDPETVFRLQHSTQSGRYDIFTSYTDRVDQQAQRLLTLRGLFRLTGTQQPVPLSEVEPVSSIVRRFSTGAMSYGSISAEAHETLAIAMNRLGGRSNTGEGGEDPERYLPLPNGDSRRSAVKQVASGRFGVTSEYLVNADDLQIKMAQGAKPGEGGQLPGYKVYPWIARTRHSTPGVGLISPPPHHDIYSIEDLKQLIHDLKNANDRARVHVKLVSEVGVGTVAAGVAKAKADVILISGHDGGTGASPLTSLKHAGAPWELGLAETQQTLLLNGLRDRVVLQTDGQLKTGRDVMIAALLGAEEYGFATAPLVVMGCVMMRVCHLDTCPVGVATQNPELRARFRGTPELVETFFTFIAEQVREHLAALGLRSLDEAIGRVDLIDTTDAVAHWKADGLDLSRILYCPPLPAGAARRHVVGQDHGLADALDQDLIRLCAPALTDGEPVRAQLTVRNINRTVGTLLGAEVTRRWGGDGLPDGTIDLSFEGTAGQSFGAFIPRGITLRLAGDANDYLGKGLSGGRIVVRPPRLAQFVAAEQVIAGNVALYGATGGEAFISGVVGERFAVRNSGAIAVVEGVGDHACEYMTGGRVVILGATGRNLAAGMSGGIAYVLDLDPVRVNSEMVRLRQPDGEEIGFLAERLRDHREATGSRRAAELLAQWPAAASRFTVVMPRDYERVLLAEQQARRDGTDIVTAIMAAAHG